MRLPDQNMLTNAELRCPRCESADHRRSRWLSHGERVGNPGMRPFRCNACRHRFLGLDPERTRSRAGARRKVAIAAVVAIVAIGLALFYGPGGRDAGERSDAVGEWPATLEETTFGADPLVDAPRDQKQIDALVARLQEQAEKGDTRAMNRLGVMHKYGVGLLQDYDAAAKWIQQSAYGGYPDGMLELGRLYRDGIGVAKDPILAYVWFNRAAAEMNLLAVREREEIRRSLTVEQLKAAQELSGGDGQDHVARSQSAG